MDGTGVREAIAEVAELAADVAAAVNAVVRGREEVVDLTLVALFSGGHLLIEDVPGVGKTLLAKSLAMAVGGNFARIQATPDLLPSDVTGSSVYQPMEGDWVFHPGPIFANLIVVDEINRATPRTQSALLEAMQERQVSASRTTWRLPSTAFSMLSVSWSKVCLNQSACSCEMVMLLLVGMGGGRAGGCYQLSEATTRKNLEPPWPASHVTSM